MLVTPDLIEMQGEGFEPSKALGPIPETGHRKRETVKPTGPKPVTFDRFAIPAGNKS